MFVWNISTIKMDALFFPYTDNQTSNYKTLAQTSPQIETSLTCNSSFKLQNVH